jgi:hypothetical protein
MSWGSFGGDGDGETEELVAVRVEERDFLLIWRAAQRGGVVVGDAGPLQPPAVTLVHPPRPIYRDQPGLGPMLGPPLRAMKTAEIPLPMRRRGNPEHR